MTSSRAANAFLVSASFVSVAVCSSCLCSCVAVVPTHVGVMEPFRAAVLLLLVSGQYVVGGLRDDVRAAPGRGANPLTADTVAKSSSLGAHALSWGSTSLCRAL